jgi:hypothetical protein
MFHVTDRANRASIERHGLDWRKMGGQAGIAGSGVPEEEAIFLAEDLSVARFFVEMGGWHDLHDIDVWEVSLDLEVDLSSENPSPGTPLVRHEDGFLCYRRPIPPERLKLVDRESLRNI